MRQQYFWIVATIALLAFPIAFWSRISAPLRTHAPRSPVDLSHPGFAAQWRFLDATLRDVPPGESFTVIASTPDEEMSLFMIAIGLAGHRRPLPTSYWNTPQPEIGGLARYLLVYRPGAACPTGTRQVAQSDGGCLCDRLRG
ncbi:MAG: hypothetical protein ACYC7A_01230 [Thermoanaerobaculia bacterium]